MKMEWEIINKGGVIFEERRVEVKKAI